MHTRPAEAAVVDRAFVRVAGPDAEAYLQGQLSQDMAIVGRGEPAASFLLEPTGKVIALLRVVREAGDAFLLDTDPEAGDDVLGALRRFLLRTKADVEPVGHRVARVFGAAPPSGIPAVWPEPTPVDLLDDDTAPTIDAAEYHRRRIEAGVPVSGVDIGPDTIPGEVGRWAIDAAVSFTKGCFTGQELVARVDSRGGNVPRPLRVLRFDGDAPAAGADVLDEGGTTVGRVTSTSADVALGRLNRKVDVGAVVTVDGQRATMVR